MGHVGVVPRVEAGAHLLEGPALESELAEPIVDGAQSLLGKCDVGSREVTPSSAIASSRRAAVCAVRRQSRSARGSGGASIIETHSAAVSVTITLAAIHDCPDCFDRNSMSIG